MVTESEALAVSPGHTIAGSVVAGCFSTLIGHPLDTIKVHQQTQTQTKPQYAMNKSSVNLSSLQVAKNIVNSWHGRQGTNTGNLRRLFQGMGPAMANQIIMNTIMFSVFHKVKDIAAAKSSIMLSTNNDTRGCKSNDNGSSNNNTASAIAGLMSGFATACISTPSDWLKIQAQLVGTGRPSTHATSLRTDAISILRRLLHDCNFNMLKVTKTLYRGHMSNLAREGVFTMVYLGLYDQITSSIVANANANTNGNQDQELEYKGLKMYQVILISSFTGACAWICNYPFDTVKSVMQGQPALAKSKMTLGAAIRFIYTSSGGGLKGFYYGAGPSTFRAILVTSSRMVAYEKTLQLLS